MIRTLKIFVLLLLLSVVAFGLITAKKRRAEESPERAEAAKASAPVCTSSLSAAAPPDVIASDHGQESHQYEIAVREDRDAAMLRIATRLAEQDVSSFLTSQNAASPGWREFRVCLVACADKDSRATADWAIEHLPPGGNRSFALHETVGRWVATDPSGALAWADGLSDAGSREAALRILFDAWAQSDPVSAAVEVAEILNFQSRSLAVGAVAGHWARKDLNPAVKWAWGLPDGVGKIAALSKIMDVMSEMNMLAGTIVRHKGAKRSIIRKIGLILGVGEEGASKLASQIPGEQKLDPVFRIHLARWTTMEPEAALAWASLLSDEFLRSRALSIVAQVLAKMDADSASAVAETIPNERQRRIASGAIAFYRSQNNSGEGQPAAPDDESLDVPTDPNEVESSSSGVKTSTTADDVEDPQEVNLTDVFSLPWQDLVPLVEQLPDGQMRDGLTQRTATLWGKDDPVAAIAWLAAEVPDGLTLWTTLRVIVCQWTARDSGAAIVWAQEQPVARKEHALLSVILELMGTDPVASSGLVNGILTRATRDSAISIVAYRWALISPSAATTWAEGLVDEQDRSLALQKIQDASQR